MKHYKSWAALNKQLSGFLCEECKNRISFFLTRYHKVHNSYGRAAIRLDGREIVCFSWIEMYRKESDLHKIWEETGIWDENNLDLKKKWDADAVYCDMDFLEAAVSFLDMTIKEALNSDNYIVRIFAILDRRVGKRTLRKIKEENSYQNLPVWVNQFYRLRFSLSEISGVELKPADNSDIVAEIVEKTISTIYPHYYPCGAVHFFLDLHKKHKIEAAMGTEEIYLAVVQGETIGTGSIRGNEICRLFILPEYQGKGYGTRLMDLLEEKVFQNYPNVHLAASFPAENMYLKRGYQIVSYQIIETENGDFLCYHTMEKKKIS